MDISYEIKSSKSILEWIELGSVWMVWSNFLLSCCFLCIPDVKYMIPKLSKFFDAVNALNAMSLSGGGLDDE